MYAEEGRQSFSLRVLTPALPLSFHAPSCMVLMHVSCLMSYANENKTKIALVRIKFLLWDGLGLTKLHKRGTKVLGDERIPIVLNKLKVLISPGFLAHFFKNERVFYFPCLCA